MKKILSYYLICVLSFLLASCATQSVIPSLGGTPHEKEEGPQIKEGQLTPINGPTIGLESMDDSDKDKMSHALDKGLGKPTEWTNPRTGINYAVVPISKLTYQNNPFCRKYSVTASRNGANRTFTGTACVSATDSGWHTVD